MTFVDATTFYYQPIECTVSDEEPITPTDWWVNVLKAMKIIALEDVMSIEEYIGKDDSWKNMSLLMAAADHHQFLQHAYDQRQHGRLHVEFVIDTE
jgi:hypothetical protein